MKMVHTVCFYLMFTTVIVVGCAQKANDSISLNVREMASPCAPGSGEPNLFAAADGRIFLSWIEAAGDTRHSLRYALREENGWSRPQTIAEGKNWFVNWADFPSLIVMANGSLAAHWLAKSGEGTYAYDVNITQSSDGGKTWSQPLIPHRDATQTEHGFVSLLPWTNDRLLAVWLDGRNFANEANGHEEHGSPSNEMMLRSAMIDKDGQFHDERILDARTCECCQTSAALTENSAVVVYRDRMENEIRDISIVRFENGQWTEPRPVHDDGWEHHGCPVNGPAVAADGNRLAVAWFTMANDTPRVKVAFSKDGGATFGKPIDARGNDPIGRVDVVMLAENAALVSWMEQIGDNAKIRIRRVHADGRRDQAIPIAESSAGRASGFPQMARNDHEIVFAWTQPGNPSTVHTAVASLARHE